MAQSCSSRAREALQGRWLPALGLLLIVKALDTGLSQLIAQLMPEGTLCNLLLAVVRLIAYILLPGAYDVYLRLLEGQSLRWTDLLCGFRNPGRILLYSLLAELAGDVPMLLLSTLSGFSAAFGSAFPLILSIIGAIARFYLYLRFLCCPLFFLTHPDETATSLLSRSWKVTKGQIWRYIRFTLPFLGWAIPFIAFHFGGEALLSMLAPNDAFRLYALLSPFVYLLTLPLQLYFYVAQTAFFLDLDAAHPAASTDEDGAVPEPDAPEPDGDDASEPEFFDEDAFNAADEKCRAREGEEEEESILQPLIDRIRNSKL